MTAEDWLFIALFTVSLLFAGYIFWRMARWLWRGAAWLKEKAPIVDRKLSDTAPQWLRVERHQIVCLHCQEHPTWVRRSILGDTYLCDHHARIYGAPCQK